MREQDLKRDQIEEAYQDIYREDPLDPTVNFCGSSIPHHRAIIAWEIALERSLQCNATPRDMRILRELNAGSLSINNLYLYWRENCRNLEICIAPTNVKTVNMCHLWD